MTQQKEPCTFYHDHRKQSAWHDDRAHEAPYRPWRVNSGAGVHRGGRKPRGVSQSSRLAVLLATIANLSSLCRFGPGGIKAALSLASFGDCRYRSFRVKICLNRCGLMTGLFSMTRSTNSFIYESICGPEAVAFTQVKIARSCDFQGRQLAGRKC